MPLLRDDPINVCIGYFSGAPLALFLSQTAIQTLTTMTRSVEKQSTGILVLIPQTFPILIIQPGNDYWQEYSKKNLRSAITHLFDY